MRGLAWRREGGRGEVRGQRRDGREVTGGRWAQAKGVVSNYHLLSRVQFFVQASSARYAQWTSLYKEQHMMYDRLSGQLRNVDPHEEQPGPKTRGRVLLGHIVSQGHKIHVEQSQGVQEPEASPRSTSPLTMLSIRAALTRVEYCPAPACCELPC